MLAALLASAKPYLQGFTQPNHMDPCHLFIEKRSGSADLLKVLDLGSSRFGMENEKVHTTMYATNARCKQKFNGSSYGYCLHSFSHKNFHYNVFTP